MMMKIFWKVVILAAERAAEMKVQAAAREALAARVAAIAPAAPTAPAATVPVKVAQPTRCRTAASAATVQPSQERDCGGKPQGKKPRQVPTLDAAIDRAIQRSSTAAARTAPGEAREWLPLEAEESAETAAWFESKRRAYRNPRSREQRGREWATRMSLNRFDEPKHAHKTTVRVSRDGAATWEWRTHADGNKAAKRDEDAHEEKQQRRTGRKSRQGWDAEADHSSSDAQYVMWVLEQTLHWDTDWSALEINPLNPRGLWRLRDGRTVRTG